MKRNYFIILLLNSCLAIFSQPTTHLMAKYTFNNNSWTNEINNAQSGTALKETSGTLPALEANNVARNSTVLHQYPGVTSSSTRSYTRFPNPIQSSSATGLTVSVWVNRIDGQPWDGLWGFLDGVNKFYLNPNAYLGYNNGASAPNLKWFDCNWPGRLATAVVPIGQWSMVTVTLNASGFGIYLNGNLIYTQSTCDWASNVAANGSLFDYSQVLNLVNSAPYFYFGYGSNWGSAALLLDDLYIYKTVLSANDVLSLYKNSSRTITSTTSGTWGAAGTWDANLVPTQNDNVVIANGHTLTSTGINANACLNLTINSGALTLDDNVSVLNNLEIGPTSSLTLNTSKTLDVTGNLTLKSSASGTGTFLNNGTTTVIGTTAVEQYLATTRNWYVSSPVAGATAQAGYTWYERNETAVTWPSVSTNGALTQGKGYIALPNAAASTLTFSGTLNTGNVTIPLTWSGATSKGFNLIGNPYPSHLTWTKTFVDNNASLIEPSIYYRTNTGNVNSGGNAAWSFKTYNANTNEFSPAGTTNIIPPMQAFWIRAKASGNLVLTSDLTKSHQSSNPLKAPALKNTDRQRVRLQVSNGTRTDETLLLFDTNAEDGFDIFDSPKFDEANSEVQIFTTVGTERLVMNGMKNMPLNQEIPLGFVPGNATSFSIKANEISNLPSDVRVILKDNIKNTEADLTDGLTTYQFTHEVNTVNHFALLFRAPGITTGIGNTSKLKAQVFVNAANQITIIAPEKSNYVIYNAMGQLFAAGVTTSNFQTSNIKLAAGVYFVQLSVNGLSEVQKVIIR